MFSSSDAISAVAKLVNTSVDHLIAATTMALSLPSDLQQFADQQIASGKYSSLEDVLLARLQTLTER